MSKSLNSEYWIYTLYDYFGDSQSKEIVYYLINSSAVRFKHGVTTVDAWVRSEPKHIKNKNEDMIVSAVRLLLQCANKLDIDLWESCGLEVEDNVKGVRIQRFLDPNTFMLQSTVYVKYEEIPQCICPRDIWLYQGCSCGCIEKERARNAEK
jgi:hypothetical protein